MNRNLIPNDSEMYLGKSCASISLLKRSLVSASIAAASLTLLSTTGTAGTLFSDDFTGMSTGTPSVADLNADGWYFDKNAGTALRVDVDNTAPLSGNALQNYGSSGSWTYALKQFNATTLSNIGDSITLSLDYHQTAVGTSYLYVALLNSANKVTSNNLTTASAVPDADGYGVIQYPWSTTSIEKTVDDPGVFSLSGLTSTGVSSANLGDGLAHTLSLTLTKVATGTQISWTADGGNTLVATDTTATIYNTFNTVRLMDTPGAGYVYLDNISVTTNVPEPSSVALMAFAGGLCLLGRFQAMRRRL